MDVGVERLWTVPRMWSDETCFVVCGGESVGELDLSRLAGRRVIAINNSGFSVPDADFLVFSDRRWWDKHRGRVLAEFRGQIVTVTPMRPSPEYRLLERARMSGLTPDPRHLPVWHTTTTTAINLAVHLGARVINCLGLDGRGGWHHDPHEWKQTNKKFEYHALALRALVAPLRLMGIEARVTPASAYDFFPRVGYEEMLA